MNSLRIRRLTTLGLAILLGGFQATSRAGAVDIEGNIRTLKRYVEAHPTEVKVKFKLGTYYFFNKQFGEAIREWQEILFSRSIRLNLRSKVNLTRVTSIAYYKAGHLPHAWKYIRWAYQREPENEKVAKVYTAIARVVAIRKARAEAARKLATGPKPDDPKRTEPASPPPPPPVTEEQARAAYKDGKELYQQGRIFLNQANMEYEEHLGKAIDLFDKCVQGNYKPAQSHYYLGSSHLYRAAEETADLDKAKANLEKSIAIEEYEGAYFDLGQVYGQMGLKDKEIEAYEKAVELNPDNAEYHFHLALAYDKSSREDAPRKTFEHAKVAIRLKSEYKRRFQEVLKNSEVARKIATIVKDIIEKTEIDQLTDEDTERYAKQIQDMLGDKLDTNDLNDREKVKDFMQNNEGARKFMEKTGKSAEELLDDPRVKKLQRKFEKSQQ